MPGAPSWLSPDAWLAAGGAYGQAIAEAAAPPGSEQLAAALADDPRRLAAVVGAAPAASAVALAIARAAPAAWYVDPARPPEPAAIRQLEALLADPVAPGSRPVVVLDGPDRAAALALLPALLSRRLRPELLVLAPCARRWAARLGALAGGYPASSILVIAAGDPGDSGAAAGDPGAPPLAAPATSGEPAADDLAGQLAERAARADRAWQDGDRAGAAQLHREVAEGRRALGDPAGAALALQAAAEVTRDLREHEAAAQLLEAALALWIRVGDLPAQARCQLRLGQFADRRAEPAAAARHYQAALTLLEGLRAPPDALERLVGDLEAARATAASLGDARARTGEPPPQIASPGEPAPGAPPIPLDALRRRP
jgi:hypothetical protein